jgi:hypothetical protein
MKNTGTEGNIRASEEAWFACQRTCSEHPTRNSPCKTTDPQLQLPLPHGTSASAASPQSRSLRSAPWFACQPQHRNPHKLANVDLIRIARATASAKAEPAAIAVSIRTARSANAAKATAARAALIPTAKVDAARVDAAATHFSNPRAVSPNARCCNAQAAVHRP